jgi:hypothetical protein
MRKATNVRRTSRPKLVFNLFLAPLQPLAINGREQRNRLINHGSTMTIGSVLPVAPSLPSLSPLTTNVNNETSNEIDEEKEKLKTDVELLKNELNKSKEIIARLQKSEEQMRER